MLKSLENLFKLARSRKESPVENSYTNELLNNKSLSKNKVLDWEEVRAKLASESKSTASAPLAP